MNTEWQKMMYEKNMMGYETWPPIDWDHSYVIGWSEYRLGLPQLQYIRGSSNW